MIIAGGSQPAEIAAHAFESAPPDSVQNWIARNAGHTTAYDVHPAEWERRVSCAFSTTASAEVSPVAT